MSRVVNLRDFRVPSTRRYVLPPDVVRIDRLTRWGNPFRTSGGWITWAAVALGYRADEPGRRSAAVALYRAWIRDEPVAVQPESGTSGVLEYSDGLVRTIDAHVRGFASMATTLYPAPKLPERPDLERLRGKRLACWCAPLPCHGDVIAEVAP